MDDYLLYDLPRVVNYILETSGAEQLHWVGHSFGGVLGYFFQILKNSHQLRSFTTFASSFLNNTQTYYRNVSSLLGNYPVHHMYRVLAPFSKYNLSWNRFLWNVNNLTPQVKKKLMMKAFAPISLFEWDQVKIISSAEDMLRLSDRGGLRHPNSDGPIMQPILALAGNDDWLCPVDDVEMTLRQFQPKAKLQLLSKDNGYSVNYGHMDTVCGIHAVDEVWPITSEWLLEND